MVPEEGGGVLMGEVPLYRYPANSAHRKEPLPDYGLGYKKQVLEELTLFPLRSEAVGRSRNAGPCSVYY